MNRLIKCKLTVQSHRSGGQRLNVLNNVSHRAFKSIFTKGKSHSPLISLYNKQTLASSQINNWNQIRDRNHKLYKIQINPRINPISNYTWMMSQANRKFRIKKYWIGKILIVKWNGKQLKRRIWISKFVHLILK